MSRELVACLSLAYAIENLLNHLYELAESLPVISSHEHLLSDPIQNSLDLDQLVANSYLRMLKIPAGRNAEEHSRFLEQWRHNNFFVWIEKSIQCIYGFTEKITAGNWDNDFCNDQE